MFIDDLLTEDIHYIYSPLSLLNNEWKWDNATFSALPKDKLILINCASENWGMGSFIDDLYSRLDQIRPNFLVMTHLPEDHLRKSRLIYYPYWYHYSVRFFTKIHKFNLVNNLKKYKISCLNRVPRAHRIYNYFLLKNKSYFDECITSMYSDDGNLVKRDDDYPLSQEILAWWDTYRNNLVTSLDAASDTNIVHEAFTNAYINFVTETTVSPRLFVTEKSWKPIGSGQLFMILGAPGIIAHLRGQGVDTFDDIIDHSHYDNEQNFKTRLTKIHEVLDALSNLDLEHINEQTKSRRLKNAEDFYAGNFNTKYLEINEYI